MVTTMTFGALRTPVKWSDLPPEAWKCGLPRREQATPVKTAYFGEERRLLGRPQVGLHPLEDACELIMAQALVLRDKARRMEQQRRERECLALDIANLYNRLQRSLGLYALDAVADLRRLDCDEVRALLELAAEVMERDAA